MIDKGSAWACDRNDKTKKEKTSQGSSWHLPGKLSLRCGEYCYPRFCATFKFTLVKNDECSWSHCNLNFIRYGDVQRSSGSGRWPTTISGRFTGPIVQFRWNDAQAWKFSNGSTTSRACRKSVAKIFWAATWRACSSLTQKNMPFSRARGSCQLTRPICSHICVQRRKPPLSVSHSADAREKAFSSHVSPSRSQIRWTRSTSYNSTLTSHCW